MRHETIEKALRLIGGVGALVTLIAVYSGLLGGLRQRKGRATENAPAMARLFMRGSWPVYLGSSLAGLGVLRALWRPLPLRLSPPLQMASVILGALLYFPGLALMLWGRITMGRMHNVSTGLGAQLYADHRLVTSGPFAIVRHPMYVGGVLAEIGALLLYRTWTTLLVALNVFSLFSRARREEEILAAEFGEQWLEYARRVPAWAPRLGAGD